MNHDEKSTILISNRIILNKFEECVDIGSGDTNIVSLKVANI